MALATAGTSLLAGCDNPKANVQDCVSVRDEIVNVIQQKVTAPGTLRNARMVPGGRYSFVSAELHAPTEDKHALGDILTWATRDQNGSDFLSVDIHARDASVWPRASFDVRRRGAIESRACTGLVRGKTRAQIKCEQDQRTGSIDLPNGKDCGDL